MDVGEVVDVSNADLYGIVGEHWSDVVCEVEVVVALHGDVAEHVDEGVVAGHRCHCRDYYRTFPGRKNR